MAERKVHIIVSTNAPSWDALWLNPYEGVVRIHTQRGWLALQNPLFIKISDRIDEEVGTLTERIAADEKKIQTNADNIATNTANIKTNAEAIAELGKSKQDALTAGYGIDIAEDGTISVTIDNSLFVFKETIPERPDEGKEEKIYVIPSGGEEGNVCNEYVWIADTERETGGYWELFGSATLSIDLTDYYTKDETDKAIRDAIDMLATKDELKGYLPLDGGTITGDLTVNGITTVTAQETEDITQEAGLLVAGKDGKVSLVTLKELAGIFVVRTCTFKINATPAEATVTINGIQTDTATVYCGATVEWSVVCEGYVSQSGSQVVSEDQTITVSLREAVNGVYVAYIDAEGVKRIINPSEWDEALGEAQGVLVGNGSHEVLVSPTGEETTMKWSLTTGLADLIDGAFTTTNTDTAKEDFEGKANTAACIAAGIDEEYAAGWCNAYSHGRINAGEWWLPACGEMWMIYENFSAINNALDVIGGDAVLSKIFFTSTQYNYAYAWAVEIFSKYTGMYNKKTAEYVRAVSSFDFEE